MSDGAIEHEPPRRTFVTPAGRALDFTPLGFGSAPLGNMHRVLSEAEAEATLEAAWDAGLRYFDTAPLYGHGLSEMRMGRVLRRRPRDAFLISTKVGRLLEPCAPGEEASGIFKQTPHVKVAFDYSRDGVMRSFESSLKRLMLDRVDVLFVHDVDASTHGSREASEARIKELMDSGGWAALDELRAVGTVGAIGSA
ncbi:MAG: aldo/keto reductase [Caulobacterales bacterium]